MLCEIEVFGPGVAESPTAATDEIAIEKRIVLMRFMFVPLLLQGGQSPPCTGAMFGPDRFFSVREIFLRRSSNEEPACRQRAAECQ